MALNSFFQIWFTKIASFLIDQGYKTIDSNHAVLTKDKDTIAFYVNDLLLVGPKFDCVNNFKKVLSKTFKITNLGPCQYYLGIKIT